MGGLVCAKKVIRRLQSDERMKEDYINLIFNEKLKILSCSNFVYFDIYTIIYVVALNLV